VLVAYAVDGAGEDPVGDGVGALGCLPGFVLGGAELFFFGGVPAYGGGEEEDFCSAECGEASAFGVPLVPADEGADGALRGLRCSLAARFRSSSSPYESSRNSRSSLKITLLLQ